MANEQSQQRYEIGMVGLGVMGRNFVLNMADHGFSVAGYDTDKAKVAALRRESKEHGVCGAENVQEFARLLRHPRAVMMLVPAGAPVDSVIKDLLPHLDKSDLIMDAGNSYFKDTDLRAGNLMAKGIQFLGVECREEKMARVTARASCPAGRKRPTSASVRCWNRSRLK